MATVYVSEPTAIHLELEEAPTPTMEISLESKKIPTTEKTTKELQMMQQVEVREEEAPTKGRTIVELQMKEEPRPTITMHLEAPKPEEPVSEGR